MFKRLIISLLVAAYSSYSFAGCLKPVTPINKGDKADCTGFLFSPEKELELRQLREEYKFILEQTSLYIKQKELYQKELKETEEIVSKEREKAELWRKVAEDTTLKYSKLEENRGKRDWLFLAAGVLLTIGSGYALGQASK